MILSNAPPSTPKLTTGPTLESSSVENGNPSGFPYEYIQPPMPPPLPQDACCPPEPAASLLFGTPAPTRINTAAPTAAPTVNSSPSKNFGHIRCVHEAESSDPRSSSILTKAMAALQLSASSATPNELRFHHTGDTDFTSSDWAPNVIRLKPPVLPPIIDSPVASAAISPTISEASACSDFDSLINKSEFEPFVSPATTTVNCTPTISDQVSRHFSPCR